MKTKTKETIHVLFMFFMMLTCATIAMCCFLSFIMGIYEDTVPISMRVTWLLVGALYLYLIQLFAKEVKYEKVK